MRTVAILAPDFPPGSLPSSIRPRLFANHLEDFGWKPVVITTHPRYYECPLDSDNELLLRENLEIIRTEALRVQSTRPFGLGDLGIRSLFHHWRALKSLAQSRRVDLVFVSIPPNFSVLTARLAWSRLGIPYVVDYQDPFFSNAWWKVPAAQRPPKFFLAWALARLVEPLGIKHAAALTGVSLATTGYASKFAPGIPRAELPFGAEPAEFTFLRSHPRPNPIFDRGDGNLHLVYTGAVIPAMIPAVRLIFSAIAQLRVSRPALGRRLRVHFVGTNYAAAASASRVLPLASDAGLGDVVTEQTRRVAYLDALQIVVDASALLIPGSDEPHYTPSKIFPYALSGQPGVAVVHRDGPAPALLAAAAPNFAVVTYGNAGPLPEQTPEVAEALSRALCSEALPPDLSRLESYTARAMTRRLAGIFDAAVAK